MVQGVINNTRGVWLWIHKWLITTSVRNGFGFRDPCYMGRFVLRLRFVQTDLTSVHSDSLHKKVSSREGWGYTGGFAEVKSLLGCHTVLLGKPFRDVTKDP